MALNLTFGPVTLGADVSRDFGPHTVGAGEASAVLLLQRDVTGGLNSVPGASIDLTFSYSADGGSTWLLLASAGIAGGIITVADKGGGSHTLLQSSVGVGLDRVQGLPVKATVTLHGGPVTVQGSFTVT
jgi:hypothetical protein